jgi:formylglycine-generating enzyme required for sulfatase activity
MRAKRASALLACAGVLGALAACSAVLGITDFTSGDAGPRDATAPGDAQGPADGSSVACADGASGVMSAIGCACAQPGQLACNGNAQAQTLICTGGVWSLRSTCPSGLNCDSRLSAAQGTCAPIDPVCANAMPGQTVCSTPTTVVQCGPDLVSETLLFDCANQACVGGACTGVCTPSATQCAGNSVETCGMDGQWHMTSTCSEACSDGGCGSFNSCVGRAPGAGSDCRGSGGDAGSSDCCGSFEVPGGTFYRSYDDVNAVYMSQASPATVSGFRLDAYEVTVGRFRAFVNAVANGWRPGAGDGKHSHLNGGSGLANVGQADAGAFENGWDASWTSNLASSVAGWDSALGCQSAQGAASWTASPGGNEHQPINCITWYEAYAFCIWDGGFLPSEAEWNYAASGGSEQRVYPWSSPATSTTIDCAHANYSPMGTPPCSATGTTNVGSDSPSGDGKWGQADLAGNVWEWTLDSYAPYVTPCTDCSNVEPPLSSRVQRGGSYNVVAFSLLTSYRGQQPVATRDTSFGVRCARRP